MIEDLLKEVPVLAKVAAAQEVLWINHARNSVHHSDKAGHDSSCCLEGSHVENEACKVSPLMVEEASERLKRFAPLIMHYFPETIPSNGIIESPLREIPAMKEALNLSFGNDSNSKVPCGQENESFGQMNGHLKLENKGGIEGRLLLKMDSHLPVSGSVKARGGIYEVLKHTEDLAIAGGLPVSPSIPENKLERNHAVSDGIGGFNCENQEVSANGNCLQEHDNGILKLAEPKAREFFARHKIQVGSTGNLGLSIGIMSSAIGFEAIVHMSNDAKQWKKDLLRERGAKVIEYEGDYGKAVQKGRSLSDADSSSYFVDDENSRDLFCGYAVAGERVKAQLDSMNIAVDCEHPLFVYIPCGVGGAPGGIIYGLKLIYGNNVHCFLAEPVQAPCMLAGLASGLYNRISVQDLGLSGKTQADGLAVGRPSALVGRIIHPLLSGEATVYDSRLGEYLKMLWKSEGIFIEPSACAAFQAVTALHTTEDGKRYIAENQLEGKMHNATHIVWATGGNMVPQALREELIGQ